MTVYLDPLMSHGWVLRGRRTESCHMFAAPADLAKLHTLAAAIGLRREWLQVDGARQVPHYDLTPRRRLAAIAAGAVELDRRGALSLWREHYPREGEREGQP